MKTLISITTLLSITALLHAQSGKRALGDFSSMEVNAASTVTLTQSDSNAISTEENGLPLIETNIKNGVLHIGSNSNVTCHVWVKDLKGITVKDASTVKADNTLNTPALNIMESDASTIKLSLKAGSVHAITKDASTLKLEGTADSMDVVSSDASTVKAMDLKAGKVSLKGADASTIKVWAVNKITARATDASSISYKGSPTDKNVSATDDAVIKNDEGKKVAEGSIDIGNHSSTKDDDSASSKSGFKHHFNDSYVGFGWVSGPNNTNVNVQYGHSREFNFGLGGGYKFFKWNGIGVDVYYKSTDYFIEQNSMKMFPDAATHNQEKIAFNNLGGLVFDRFFIGKYFIDGGIYGDWIFHNRIVTFDNTSAGNTKTVIRNALPLESNFDHGVQIRVGSTKGISFYFNYRMSDLLKQPAGSTTGAPQLPPYVFGIDIGGF